MKTIPLFKYTLVGEVKEFSKITIDKKLKELELDREISFDRVKREIKNNSTIAKIVKVDYERFLKKVSKIGVDKVFHSTFKNTLNVSKKKLEEIYDRYSKSDKTYEHYVFFE